MKTEPNKPKQKKNTGHLLLSLLASIVLLAVIMLLTSCTDMPMSVGVQGKHGVYSYSAKRGIELSIDASK